MCILGFLFSYKYTYVCVYMIVHICECRVHLVFEAQMPSRQKTPPEKKRNRDSPGPITAAFTAHDLSENPAPTPEDRALFRRIGYSACIKFGFSARSKRTVLYYIFCVSTNTKPNFKKSQNSDSTHFVFLTIKCCSRICNCDPMPYLVFW
jgi:hypothetical protein